MVKLERVTQDEIDSMRKRRAQTLDLTEYNNFLEGKQIGEWGRLVLEEGDTQRTAKRRLTTASKQKGFGVKYRKTSDGQILFQLRDLPPPR